MKISLLQNEDISSLVHLVNSAYRGESSKKGWTTEADLLDGIRTDESSIKALLQKKDAVILTTKNEAGDLAGCVYLHKEDEDLYVGMLTVSPVIQSRGIGKQLLNAAEEYARHLKCAFVKMSVIEVRHELIAWYERRGYRLTGEIKPFPADPQFGIPKQPLQFVVLKKRV